MSKLVMVIQCKDCVYWSSKETRYCNMLQGTFRENDFCSHGKRKGGRQVIDICIEKKQCFDDYENGELIMSDEKCGDCEHRYTCRFMKQAMDDVVYGD